MIDSVMFWNEPNNKSHWDSGLDPTWAVFAAMVKGASQAVQSENKHLTRVLGGMSAIEPLFVKRLEVYGALESVDALAVHGFPLDWTPWQLQEWPQKLIELQRLARRPVWATEVGVSSFGAEEVQQFGLERTAKLLEGKAERVHWYSLFDLPRAWSANTRQTDRHFYMGLLHEDGTPKLAAADFAGFTPELGICQWFHFEDHRLDDAVRWLRRLGVKHLRTGLSWADSFRPNAKAWFDRQMRALEEFQVTVTFCFTPEHEGVQPHHTSPPRRIEGFAEFCAQMTRRYAR